MTNTAFLQDLIAALPLPTLVIDRAERVAALNPAAEVLVGARAVGRNFVTVLRVSKTAMSPMWKGGWTRSRMPKPSIPN